jgi:GMP reductase
MRIEEDMKLDYKDVLVRPKRSTLGSRKEVDLQRGFTFRNYQGPTVDDYRHYRGVPIMASNMDGVGTFEMADTLAEQGMFTCLVKTYTSNDLIDFFNTDYFHTQFKRNRSDYVAMSIGITDDSWGKLQEVTALCEGNLKYVCIDVANGYS